MIFYIQTLTLKYKPSEICCILTTFTFLGLERELQALDYSFLTATGMYEKKYDKNITISRNLFFREQKPDLVSSISSQDYIKISETRVK